jgi:hypothetical protein
VVRGEQLLLIHLLEKWPAPGWGSTRRARTDGKKQLVFFFFSSSLPAQEKEFIESLNDKLNSGAVRGTAAFYKNAW